MTVSQAGATVRKVQLSSSEKSLQANLRGAGCTKLGHLMKTTATSVDNLRQQQHHLYQADQ